MLPHLKFFVVFFLNTLDLLDPPKEDFGAYVDCLPLNFGVRPRRARISATRFFFSATLMMPALVLEPPPELLELIDAIVGEGDSGPGYHEK